MPSSYEAPEEAGLDRAVCMLSRHVRDELVAWWLTVRRDANVPNWDIASTCQIEGMRRLLLVEAKAHDHELSADGKSAPRSANGRKNHESIARAVDQANRGLEGEATRGWTLSRDSHYQFGNRFA